MFLFLSLHRYGFTINYNIISFYKITVGQLGFIADSEYGNYSLFTTALTDCVAHISGGFLLSSNANHNRGDHKNGKGYREGHKELPHFLASEEHKHLSDGHKADCQSSHLTIANWYGPCLITWPDYMARTDKRLPRSLRWPFNAHVTLFFTKFKHFRWRIFTIS